MVDEGRRDNSWFCAYGEYAGIVMGSWNGWLRMAPDLSDEKAREVFQAFYGQEPAELHREGDQLLAGPIDADGAPAR